MPDAHLTELVTRLRGLAADPSDGVADVDLLRRYVQDRDAVAFEALVWRHARLVMGICRRTLRHHQDAEDAFQATFLLLARKAHGVHRGAFLPAWLHTTAVRVARRAQSRRRPLLLAELPDQPIADPLPESVEAGAILDAEVRRLPARLRVAFVLCALEGRSYADAARELGCPKGTIDSRMASAKRRLQVALTRREVTLAPVAALAAAVPELAYSELARQAAVFGLNRPADVSPSVAGLLAPSGGSRWLVGLAAALALAAAGTIATVSSTAGTGDPPKSLADPRGDGPKTTDRAPAGEQRVPGMKPLFKRTTIGLPPEEDFNADGNKLAVEWLSKVYERLVEARRKSGRPMIPPAIPIASRGHLVYMNELSVAEVALTDKKTDDPPVKSNATMWSSEFDKSVQYRYRGYQALLELWLTEHGAEASDVLLNRTLKYAFSVESGFVQFIDEFPVSLPAERAKEAANEGVVFQVNKILGPFAEDIRGNVVKVTDRETGKLVIKVDRDSGRARDSTPFGGNVYLGPPLPLTGLTVLVHEKAKEVRLTCVSWERIKKAAKPPLDQGTLQAANETFVWDTVLATAPNSVVFDPRRRIHTVHLVNAGDVVFCPTHLGRVVAVEAKTGKIKWTHEYAALAAKRFETFAPEWVIVPPVVAGDKYIYAPADFPELLCLNVADGKKVWSVKKGDGLYPAVVGERVLVVGEKTVRALSLKDGSEQWKLDLPGLPCGRGAVLGDTYLVPVSEPKTWRGMIAVIDLKAGKISEVLKPEKEEPIGNLVVHKDFLISQTLTEIAVFPIRKKE